jgi:hypothetical protein
MIGILMAAGGPYRQMGMSDIKQNRQRIMAAWQFHVLATSEPQLLLIMSNIESDCMSW